MKKKPPTQPQQCFDLAGTQRNLQQQTASTDPIQHPQHYNNHPSGIECIQIAEHLNFCRGNAIKYLWRAGAKGGLLHEIDDLRKAVWYIQREIDRIQPRTHDIHLNPKD